MKYLELISHVSDVEKLVGCEAKHYGLYSVDAHNYFRNLIPCTAQEVAFVNKPQQFIFGEPVLLNGMQQYLLDHHGKLYFPAHQKGVRHGFMIEFDIEQLKSKCRKIIYSVYEEPNGQLLLEFA